MAVDEPISTGDEQGHGDQSVEPNEAAMQRGHDESLASVRDLEQQVEQAEATEGEPTPSQANADETAATGI